MPKEDPSDMLEAIKQHIEAEIYRHQYLASKGSEAERYARADGDDTGVKDPLAKDQIIPPDPYPPERLDQAGGSDTGSSKSHIPTVLHGSADEHLIEDECDTLNGRFELIKRVGTGGMGTVYKALDRSKLLLDGQQPYVAVKILNRQFRADQYWLTALQQEAKKCERLVHPNIVRVYNFHRHGSTVYITMEYLPLGDPVASLKKSVDEMRATIL